MRTILIILVAIVIAAIAYLVISPLPDSPEYAHADSMAPVAEKPTSFHQEVESQQPGSSGVITMTVGGTFNLKPKSEAQQ